MAISIQTLRDEGVLEVGRLDGTSFVYVTTKVRMCLFHVIELPPRRLDAYGAQLAISWIEAGTPSCRVAADLGISEPELRRALLAAGYARTSPAELAQIAGARAKRKLGNRRGRLVQIDGAGAPRAEISCARGLGFNDASAATGRRWKAKRAAAAAACP